LDFVWIAAALPDASHLNLPSQAPHFADTPRRPTGAFRGTDGSNPFPSSRESGANLTSAILTWPSSEQRPENPASE